MHGTFHGNTKIIFKCFQIDACPFIVRHNDHDRTLLTAGQYLLDMILVAGNQPKSSVHHRMPVLYRYSIVLLSHSTSDHGS